MLTWQATGGFSLDASVRIHDSDSAGRERLLRYCARPPFALERLHTERHATLPDTPGPGETATVRRVHYQPLRPTPDGRTVLTLSPLDFLAALSRLIPPPRVHRHRYHGVLAPNARLRQRVVALGHHDAEPPLDTDARPDGDDGAIRATATSHPQPPTSQPPDAPRHGAARSRWAQLIARIYEAFPLLCPTCGGELRILAFLTDPPPVRDILQHLDLPTSPPPLSPARGPPQHQLDLDSDPELDIDQTPAYDPAEPEPIPDLDPDQSAGA